MSNLRFENFAESSLDIWVRVFVKTREWNDYYAVQEDVLFRIGDIVKDAGAKLAFPSQTLYIGRDAHRDADGSQMARNEVARWRERHQLPFPNFPSSRIDEIEDTLSYPPAGSPDFYATDEELSKGGERLSAAEPPENQEPSQGETPSPEEDQTGDVGEPASRR